jgi:hypothetical protein
MKKTILYVSLLMTIFLGSCQKDASAEDGVDEVYDYSTPCPPAGMDSSMDK